MNNKEKQALAFGAIFWVVSITYSFCRLYHY